MKCLYELTDGVTRTITAENPTGEKGKAAMAMPDPGSAAEQLGQGWKCRPFLTVEPQQEADLCCLEGCGEITSLWMAGDIGPGLILRMYWEDCPAPAVECPLPSFFGYGWAEAMDAKTGNWGKGPAFCLNSALMSVASNRGLSCFIPMPFRKKARITVENRTRRPKMIYYQINLEEQGLPERIGYFHAQFRMSCPVPKGKTHCILGKVNGEGTYLGTALYVGLNRSARWWGEGEVKFYLDGDEAFPTVTSTGLEDYFLGACNWECEKQYQTYSNLYSGVPQILYPDGLYEIQQRFSMYRWHVRDPIRFRQNIRVEVQALGWMKDADGIGSRYLQREDDYISVSYFYLHTPSVERPELPSQEVLTEWF